MILEDECEGMDREMLCSYEQFLKKVIKNHMAAILICHSDMATSVWQIIILFSEEDALLKMEKNSAYNNGEISDYLLGGTMIQKKTHWTVMPVKYVREKILYIVYETLQLAKL